MYLNSAANGNIIFVAILLQLIYIGEFTKALEKSWHIEHFACHNCDVPLTGKKYIVNRHHPFCQRCFTENIANKCCVCKKPIGPEGRDLFVKDNHYHKECLICSKCHSQLVGVFAIYFITFPYVYINRDTLLCLIVTGHRVHFLKLFTPYITP